MSQLFSPVTFGPLTLSNRIVIAPMCQYSSTDGLASDWHRQHLGMLAQSGAGLLILEATAVLPEGRISYADLGLWDDATEAALTDVIASVKRWSPMPVGVQLAHAGRKASSARPWDGGGPLPPTDPNGWTVKAPSALPFTANGPTPEALDEAGIDAVVEAFAVAAKRAERAGLDLIELHAAHGYLLHQFLSPLSNERDDEYGGSLENRARLLVETADAVRAAWPDHKSLFVRLSATDWVEGGLTVDEVAQVAKELGGHGVDLVDVSTGGNAPAEIPVGPGYQVPAAREVRETSAVPVAAVGLLTDPAQAEAVLADGSADAILLGREGLRDPFWPLRAAHELGVADPNAWQPQYARATWA